MNSKLAAFLTLCALCTTINADCSSSSNSNQTFVISNNQQVLFEVDGSNQTVSVNNSRLFVNGIDVNAFLELYMNRPAITVSHTLAQNVTSNDTPLNWNTEEYKSHPSMHTNVGVNSSRLYAPIKGLYQVSAIFNFDPTPSQSFRFVRLMKNSIYHREVMGIATSSFYMSTFIDYVYLNVDDYVAVWVNGNCTFRNNNFNSFSMRWINV